MKRRGSAFPRTITHRRMCTVSIIPIAEHGSKRPDGFRLVTNRDESHSRPDALPPRDHRLACGTTAVWPLDPAAGGTWIGVNSHGVALAVLNVYPFAPATLAPTRSRGLIIPALSSSPSAADAAARLTTLDLSRFPGFRLIVADTSNVIECRSEHGRVWVCEGQLAACCFSSHGHGDRHARHRLRLFENWVSRGHFGRADQDAFHRHRWNQRPEISVRMSRSDAVTTSITSVEVLNAPGSVPLLRMDYEALSDASERRNRNERQPAAAAIIA